MKNVIRNLLSEIKKSHGLVLATIIEVKGPAPQVIGASCIISGRGLVDGTLGGGILEADALQRSGKILKSGKAIVYEFSLDSSIEEPQGAICGGKVRILLDSHIENSFDEYSMAFDAVSNRKKGAMLTRIRGNDEVITDHFWYEETGSLGNLPAWLLGYIHDIQRCIGERKPDKIKLSDSEALFIQPVLPQPRLIIAGAGHIGKALAHLGSLIDFEVTVLDHRPEFANSQNLPDAHQVITGNIASNLERMIVDRETFIVIVTHGHQKDGETLRQCINSEAAYLGMIGSRKKVKMMRDEFIKNGWATEEQFDRVHAPIGLDIHSVTVNEIAVSICAELIRERAVMKQRQGNRVEILILAAGASSRMGQPKMILPYGNSTIIEQVITQATNSEQEGITIVLGKGSEEVIKLINKYPVKIVVNHYPEQGMLSSIKSGMKEIPANTGAVLIMLGDQPMVDSEVISRLTAAFSLSRKGILIASYRNKKGHPVLLSEKYFKEILDLSPDKSLRDIIERNANDIELVETENPDILKDIDTPEDYKNELFNSNHYDRNHQI